MSSPSRDEEEEVIRISIFISFHVYSTECLQRSFFFSLGGKHRRLYHWHFF